MKAVIVSDGHCPMAIPFIQLLSNLPAMSELDAEPAFLHSQSDDSLSTMLLAYRTKDGQFAVLAFVWEDSFKWEAQMPPEQLEELKKYGLNSHAFYRVDNADKTSTRTVITFQHSTIQISANGPEVLEKSMNAASSLDAILAIIGKHRYRFPVVRQP